MLAGKQPDVYEILGRDHSSRRCGATHRLGHAPRTRAMLGRYLHHCAIGLKHYMAALRSNSWSLTRAATSAELQLELFEM